MIKARIKAQNLEANLKSYDETYQAFSWSEVEKAFTWHRTGKLNIGHEAVDRWAADPAHKNQPALVFEKNRNSLTFSYRELKEKSSQWAGLFKEYGFKTGDRLFIFLPTCPEIYLAMLGSCRLGVAFCPVFSSFSFDELQVRLENAQPRGILTHPDLAEKIPLEAVETVEHIFFTQSPLPGLFPNEVLTEAAVDQVSTELPPVWLPGETPLYLNYTSGSTGPPKGVVHAHNDMIGMLISARYGLDLQPDTLIWTDADPAWVTGTVYGLFAPLLCGSTAVIQGDPFSAAQCYWLLEKHRVAIWYTTPHNLRTLMDAGDDLPGRYDLSHLRHIASAGAPLVPELFYWVKQNLKLAPHDTYWMTETGMICVANFPCLDIKPGSMGKAHPGIKAAVMDESGEILPPMTMGELALRVGWPNLMQGLWQDEKRFKDYFRMEGWFLTGDIVVQDEEGYYYHQGRNDDLIKAGADKVIGPYEIERVLCKHPLVKEAAVISKGMEPGQGVSYLKAFISLKQNTAPSARLNHEIKAFVKANLTDDVVVQDIAFLEILPKTRSGKLLRRVLRAGELGLPGGNPLEMSS